MLIAIRLATVTLTCVIVDKKKLLHTSLFAEFFLLSKKFCTVNVMMYCRSLKASPKLNSLKYSSLDTIWILTSMIVETFHLLLRCKSTFSPQKGLVNRKFLPGVPKCISPHIRWSLSFLYHLLPLISWC